MDWGAFFVVLALAVLSGLYISLPILQRQGVAVSDVEQERSSLLARQEQVLNTLAELEFDYELGKVPEAHYQARRQALLQEGADILRRLDALKAAAPRQKADLEDHLEALLAERRAKRAAAAQPSQPSQPDDEIEALLAARRRERQAKAAGFCPQCGAPVLATDRFCPRCGTRLTS
ncbi:MAG: zinc ribbon domain-containing protein [Chloroflexi bacterium]|nr:zinc ribbon domain-containing protein [Chloroflexota bacterium]